MPLNSSNIHFSVINIIREIPLDRESAPEYPYQTKVDMYDEKCSGCGFARIEVYPSDIYNAKPLIFHTSSEAIKFARVHGHRINRTCDYPFDMQKRNGKTIYPSLTEIVSNTCDLWDIDKIISEIENIPDDALILELIKSIRTNGEE